MWEIAMPDNLIFDLEKLDAEIQERITQKEIAEGDVTQFQKEINNALKQINEQITKSTIPLLKQHHLPNYDFIIENNELIGRGSFDSSAYRQLQRQIDQQITAFKKFMLQKFEIEVVHERWQRAPYPKYGIQIKFNDPQIAMLKLTGNKPTPRFNSLLQEYKNAQQRVTEADNRINILKEQKEAYQELANKKETVTKVKGDVTIIDKAQALIKLGQTKQLPLTENCSVYQKTDGTIIISVQGNEYNPFWPICDELKIKANVYDLGRGGPADIPDSQEYTIPKEKLNEFEDKLSKELNKIEQNVDYDMRKFLDNNKEFTKSEPGPDADIPQPPPRMSR